MRVSAETAMMAAGRWQAAADQPPLLIRKLGTQRAPSRRLLALTHGGKLQDEDTAKLVLRFRVVGEKGVGAVDQHATKLEGLSGKKSKALDRAAPLDNWQLAECIHRLRRLMEARMGNAGRREFIQVLRLMEDFHQHQVEQAVAQALRLGAISFDAKEG